MIKRLNPKPHVLFLQKSVFNLPGSCEEEIKMNEPPTPTAIKIKKVAIEIKIFFFSNAQTPRSERGRGEEERKASKSTARRTNLATHYTMHGD